MGKITNLLAYLLESSDASVNLGDLTELGQTNFNTLCDNFPSYSLQMFLINIIFSWISCLYDVIIKNV